MSDSNNAAAWNSWKRPEEKWPFHNTESGAVLHAERFYCFGDAGGLAGKFEGYTTAEEAIEDIIKNDVDHKEISIVMDDLGGVSVCVLSGRQFIDQLYSIGGNSDQSFFLEFGYWEGMTEDEAMTMRNEERIQG